MALTIHVSGQESQVEQGPQSEGEAPGPRLPLLTSVGKLTG